MADAGSLLGQLIGAAMSGGGSVRGGQANAGGALGDILGQVLGGGRPGAQGGAGGLGDILGQVLGGGGGAAPRSGAAPAGQGGGLNDILGQILGGGGAAGGQGGKGGGLEDILGQILGGGAPGGQAADKGGSHGGGLGDILGQVLGGGAAGGQAGRGGGGLGGIVGDALGGSPRGGAPGPAPAPQHAPAPSGGTQPNSGNDFLKYGGIAVIGMVAFNAFRKWQQSQGARAGLVPDAQAASFGPAAAPGGPAQFSQTLLAAMTAAAQADGRLDQEELTRITGGLEKMGASGMDQNALIEVLTTPVDPQTVINAATSPEAALQIYTASAIAIRADTAVEQQYLANLASALGIEPSLKAQIDRDVGA